MLITTVAFFSYLYFGMITINILAYHIRCFFSGFAINELAALVVSGVCPAIVTRISVGRTWGWQKKEGKILTYAGLEPAIS